MSKTNLSRRKFLKQTGISGVALLGSTQLSAMTSLSAANADNEYKAMVCILLAGGADSFNILVPTDNTHYNEYQKTRSDLALPQSSLLPLNNAENNGRTLGLHPRLTGIQSLYNNGKVAFISNVGTLVEPTTTESLHAGTAKLPLGLFSHSDQISQWQTAQPDVRSGTGWGGRMADMMGPKNSNKRISMSISTAGSNEFQAGRSSNYYSIKPGDNPTPSLNVTGRFDDVDQAVSQIYANENFENVLKRSYTRLFNNSMTANQEFAAALATGQPITTQFADDEFSQQLKIVAQTIAANQLLGMKRQTFFVTYGGWDHHDETINAMDAMLQPLDQGLSAFQSAMQELNLEQNVTTFTSSDFARTLSSNGRGSDHAWGGNAFVMGGAVNGGSIYGTYPSLALGNPLDVGRGVLMPTTSLDNYFAELALWFGVAPTELSSILPNIGRFYDVNSGSKPMGFMN